MSKCAACVSHLQPAIEKAFANRVSQRVNQALAERIERGEKINVALAILTFNDALRAEQHHAP